jgi:hypothetical protein
LRQGDLLIASIDPPHVKRGRRETPAFFFRRLHAPVRAFLLRFSALFPPPIVSQIRRAHSSRIQQTNASEPRMFRNK